MYRGGAEKQIRQYLVDNNFVDCVIQLPENLFFGTSISTCVLVLKKGKPNNDVLFIDASSECVKITNNNKLDGKNIDRILEAYTNRKNVQYFAEAVSRKTIEENDYSLSVKVYVEERDTRIVLTGAEINEALLHLQDREKELRASIHQIIGTIESDKAYLTSDCKPIRLGEFAKIRRGGSLQKKDFAETGIPCIHYGQIYTHYGSFTDTTISYISEKSSKKGKMAKKNEIIMAVTSENVDDVCKCVAWMGDDDVAVSGHTAIISHEQNAKFLAYYFNSEMFYAQKKRLAHGTKVIEVTPDKLEDILVPLPDRERQDKIVEAIERFDRAQAEMTKIMEDLGDMHKAQYKHYLDIIMSSKEL